MFPLVVHPTQESLWLLGWWWWCCPSLNTLSRTGANRYCGTGWDVGWSLSYIFLTCWWARWSLVVTIYHQNGLSFCETVRLITISSSTMRQIHLDIRKGSLPRNFTETVTEPWRGRNHDLSAWESLLWRGWVSLPKHAPKGQSSLPISRVYQAHIPTSPAGYWLFWICIEKIPPCQRFWQGRLEKRQLFTEYYTANLHVGPLCCLSMLKTF